MVTALEADAGEYAAELTDLSGRIVWKEQISTGEQAHDISKLPAGMYLLKVETPGGAAVRKLVVE